VGRVQVGPRTIEPKQQRQPVQSAKMVPVTNKTEPVVTYKEVAWEVREQEGRRRTVQGRKSGRWCGCQVPGEGRFGEASEKSSPNALG
jgi:hypothetical protein